MQVVFKHFYNLFECLTKHAPLAFLKAITIHPHIYFFDRKYCESKVWEHIVSTGGLAALSMYTLVLIFTIRWITFHTVKSDISAD